MLSRLLESPAIVFRFLVLFALCLGHPGSRLEAADSSAFIDGTFLQLSLAHKGWTEAKWLELFGYFRRLQLSQVILQWTAYDEAVFYETPTGKSDAALDKILKVAAQSGMKVWVGLYHERQYWTRIGRDPGATSLYLERLRSKSLAIARDLTPLLERHACFAGWYLTEEIDDVNWQSPAARRELLLHLNLAGSGLDRLIPGARIAISAFSNARLSPGQWRDFWKEIFGASSINTVFLQDGVGALKLELNEFPVYAEALAAAARDAGREFSIVAELFQQVGGTPLDSGDFKALPATWQRVSRQLAVARRFTNSIVGFSVPEYMSPMGTQGAEELYVDYLRERINRK
jgi:hypothetical protein